MLFTIGIICTTEHEYDVMCDFIAFQLTHETDVDQRALTYPNTYLPNNIHARVFYLFDKKIQDNVSIKVICLGTEESRVPCALRVALLLGKIPCDAFFLYGICGGRIFGDVIVSMDAFGWDLTRHDGKSCVQNLCRYYQTLDKKSAQCQTLLDIHSYHQIHSQNWQYSWVFHPKDGLQLTLHSPLPMSAPKSPFVNVSKNKFPFLDKQPPICLSKIEIPSPSEDMDVETPVKTFLTLENQASTHIPSYNSSLGLMVSVPQIRKDVDLLLNQIQSELKDSVLHKTILASQQSVSHPNVIGIDLESYSALCLPGIPIIAIIKGISMVGDHLKDKDNAFLQQLLTEAKDLMSEKKSQQPIETCRQISTLLKTKKPKKSRFSSSILLSSDDVTLIQNLLDKALLEPIDSSDINTMSRRLCRKIAALNAASVTWNLINELIERMISIKSQ